MTISLFTVFYNFYDRYLGQWLDAVLAGDELPDEIVLLVSGKDFDPENITQAVAKMQSRVKYRIVYAEHAGMGNARNKAVQAANSEWIMHLCVDDKITKNGMANIKRRLSDEVDILMGNMDWIGHPTKSGTRKYALSAQDFYAGKTNDHAVYRKTAWAKSPYIEYSGDVDVAFWIGLAQTGATIGHIDSVLTQHFFGPQTVCGKHTREDIREIRRMMQVWRTEGVHSDRFQAPEYKIEGDYNFRHKTITRLSIIIAFRSDGSIRDKHKAWTHAHYRKMFPDAEIIIAEDKTKQKGWDTFNKSKLINEGVRKSTGNVLFITDVDMVFIKNKISKAVEEAFSHSIVFPHDAIYFADEKTTRGILGLRTSDAFPKVDLSGMKVKTRKAKQPGGCFVITRQHYDQAGGHDERFVGWGSEDSVFIKAATTLIDLPYLRIPGASIHLFHPVDPERAKKRDESEKVDLVRQYFNANGNKEAMEKVIWKQ